RPRAFRRGRKMSRFLTVTAVMMVAGLVTVQWIDDNAKQPRSAAKIAQFDRQTIELVLHYQTFKDALESAVEDLAAGRVRLRQAAYSVRETADVHCPIYLDRLKVVEPGATDEERVAHNLVGHLRDRGIATPEMLDRAAEVECELDTVQQ